MKYEEGFKKEAVKLAVEIGIKKAGEELGVPYYTLREWKRKEREYGEIAYVGSGRKRIEKGREREIELEKELNRVKRANEILKGALSFFVREQKR
jgi:transposase